LAKKKKEKKKKKKKQKGLKKGSKAKGRQRCSLFFKKEKKP